MSTAISIPAWWRRRIADRRGTVMDFGDWSCGIVWVMRHILAPNGDLVLIPSPLPPRKVNLRKLEPEELIAMGFDPDEIAELLA